MSTHTVAPTDIDITTVSFTINAEIKNEAEELFEDLGLDLATAIRIFIKQSIRKGGFPFAIEQNKPNAETIAAMLEAERLTHDPNAKSFTSADELFAYLDSDDGEV